MVDTCKLCGEPAQLVGCSHVIPQWMYSMLPQDERRFRIASSHAGEFEQRSPTGFYGKFVCQTCEDRFTRWDTYASEVLRRVPNLTDNGWDYGPYKIWRIDPLLSVCALARQRMWASILSNR